ncbi:MAG: hypothetical protein HC811_10135 [Flammeovirgaceae bacterium]|nr:hypothetical protein [Flammeovirgaceae bacterium]
MEDSAKYLYTGTRDFIWSIDPSNDELSKLFLHIRDFGEKLFEEKKINFRAHNELHSSVPVPYGFSREANLIFKEAMTNAFNHSGAKNVNFSLRKKEDHFEFTLTDDGAGFEVDSLERVSGLKNMRARAKRIQSTYSIESDATKGGTTVRLLFQQLNQTKHGRRNKKKGLNH